MDTNILLAPAEHMIDLFSSLRELMQEPYEILVMQTTLDELRKIGEKKGKEGRAALLGLTLVQTKLDQQQSLFEKVLGLHQTPDRVKVVKTLTYADDAIVETVGDEYLVMTQDRKLQKRVQKKGAGVITLVKGKQLRIL